MRMILRAISYLCAVLILASLCQAKDWRGIVPLKSTRADVERLLGKPSDMWRCCFYDLGDESVMLVYASGISCVDGIDAMESAWRVPRDTVIAIFVRHKSGKVKLSDLKIEASKYKRQENRHLPGFSNHFSVEEGVDIELYKDEVIGVAYLPAAKDEHLQCP
jgi:hypothetical protein